jgi:glycosyltransferase involved in cell wall biosynthesis
MKIAILAGAYLPEDYSALAKIYYNLAHGLTRHGHEVHVICYTRSKPSEYVDEGVFVYRLPVRGDNTIAWLNYIFCAVAKVKEVIKKHSIQIVDTCEESLEGFVYSLSKKSPLVVTALGVTNDYIKMRSYTSKIHWAKLKLLTQLIALLLKRADRVLAISEASYQALIERFNVSPARIVNVGLGIDTDKFSFTQSDIREKLEILSSTPVVLFVGRLEIRNGVHVLLQAIPQVIRSLPNTKFVFVGRDPNLAPGGGSFKDYIMRTARSSDFESNILLIDVLPDDELVQLYSASDIYVYPALSSNFGFPIAEAMACGKPVVTTPVGIVPELEYQARGGLTVVPIGEPTELAEAIINCLSLRQEDREIIAKRNRDIIESQFSIPAWVDKVIEVYAGLL